MDMEKLAEIFEAVKVLPLRPTDYIVFRAKGSIRPEIAARIRQSLEDLFGKDRKVIVIGDDADIEIVRPEDVKLA